MKDLRETGGEGRKVPCLGYGDRDVTSVKEKPGENWKGNKLQAMELETPRSPSPCPSSGQAKSLRSTASKVQWATMAVLSSCSQLHSTPPVQRTISGELQCPAVSRLTCTVLTFGAMSQRREAGRVLVKVSVPRSYEECKAGVEDLPLALGPPTQTQGRGKAREAEREPETDKDRTGRQDLRAELPHPFRPGTQTPGQRPGRQPGCPG